MTMRYLLTADWHLKPKHKFTQIVEGKVWDRLCEEKLKTLASLPRLAKKYNADVVAIAGDLFDTSNPPEALKAEVCKILNSFPESMVVKIIPGRPGDHDYVADNNYVLMDIREAYANSRIVIEDNPSMELELRVLMTHLMLEGINDLYRNTVPISDPRFRDYSTILLGDYHGWYVKKFGKKTFIYPGPPYPTRFGETCRYIGLVVTGENGFCKTVKKIGLKSYQLTEAFDIDEDITSNFGYKRVVKFKLVVPSDKMAATLHQLQQIKRNIEDHEEILDVIWEVKSKDAETMRKEVGKKSFRDTCLDYIDEKAKYPKTTKKIFCKMEAQV